MTHIRPEIGQLQNLRNLRILYLSNNEITNMWPEIGHLKNLRVLCLSYNHMTRQLIILKYCMTFD